MNVSNVMDEDFAKFLIFNRTVYHSRDRIDESIEFKFNHPLSKDKSNSSLIVKMNNDIVGQMQRIPCICKNKGEIIEGYWGMDFVVDKNHRGFAGVDLLEKALSENQFALGLSEKAYKLHRMMGVYHIGNYHKYIYFNPIKSIFLLILKNLKFYHYNTKLKTSKVINMKKFKFELVDNYDEHQFNVLNNNILNFSRDADFVKWRFGTYPNTFKTYTLYHENKIKCYFVIRLFFWKSYPFILLVDYRYEPGFFNLIIKAVKKILCDNMAFGIITLSSISNIDQILKKSFFLHFGENGQIMTNINFNFSSESIFKRTNIMVTFADSDCDFYYGNKEWYV
jgi:hypothetical protein